MFGLRRKSYRGRAPNPLLGKSTNPLLGKSQNPLLMKLSYTIGNTYVLSKYTLDIGTTTDKTKWENALNAIDTKKRKPPQDCLTASQNLNGVGGISGPIQLKFKELIKEMLLNWGVQDVFPKEFLDSIVFGKFNEDSGFWIKGNRNAGERIGPGKHSMLNRVVPGHSINEDDTLLIVDINLILLEERIFNNFLNKSFYAKNDPRISIDSAFAKDAFWYQHYFSSKLESDDTLNLATVKVIHEFMHAWISYTNCFKAEDYGDLFPKISRSEETLASMLTNIFIKAAEISKTSSATKKMALRGSMAMIIDALRQVKKSVDKNALDVVDLYIKLSPEKYDSISWEKNDSYKTNLDNEKFPNLTQEDKAKLEGQSIKLTPEPPVVTNIEPGKYWKFEIGANIYYISYNETMGGTFYIYQEVKAQKIEIVLFGRGHYSCCLNILFVKDFWEKGTFSGAKYVPPKGPRWYYDFDTGENKSNEGYLFFPGSAPPDPSFIFSKGTENPK